MIHKRIYYIRETIAWGMELLSPKRSWECRLCLWQIRIAFTKIFCPSKVF